MMTTKIPIALATLLLPWLALAEPVDVPASAAVARSVEPAEHAFVERFAGVLEIPYVAADLQAWASWSFPCRDIKGVRAFYTTTGVVFVELYTWTLDLETGASVVECRNLLGTAPTLRASACPVPKGDVAGVGLTFQAATGGAVEVYGLRFACDQRGEMRR